MPTASPPKPTVRYELGPLVFLGPGDVSFNPWNPNKMDSFMYQKAMESIRQNGMVDPCLVREVVGRDHPRYEIIDGEHRARVCLDLGQRIPAHSIGVVPDERAKRLTIALNEIHGTANPAEMGKLLDELLSDSSIEDLLSTLPMTEDTVKAFTGAAGIEWPEEPKPAHTRTETAQKERWVERTYRIPSSVAEVLDDAISKAKQTADDVTDAQALEIIAAEYMAS